MNPSSHVTFFDELRDLKVKRHWYKLHNNAYALHKVQQRINLLHERVKLLKTDELIGSCLWSYISHDHDESSFSITYRSFTLSGVFEKFNFEEKRGNWSIFIDNYPAETYLTYLLEITCLNTEANQ